MPSEGSSTDEQCPCGHPLSYHSSAYCLGCLRTCAHQHPEGWAASAADEQCGTCGHPRILHVPWERDGLIVCLLCWDPDECMHPFKEEAKPA